MVVPVAGVQEGGRDGRAIERSAADIARSAVRERHSLRPGDFHFDPSDAERRRTATLVWYQEMLRGQYERVGSRDPRWDADVFAGLDGFAAVYARVPDRPADTWERAGIALTRALEAGCDDPLVHLLAAEAATGTTDRRSAGQRVHGAALALEQSAYPAYWRGYGLIAAGAAILEAARGLPPDRWEPFWREISHVLDRALTLYPEVLQDRQLPDDVGLSYINWLATTFVQTTRRDRSVVETPAVEAIQASRGAEDPLIHLLRGWFAAHSAWDARGTDWGTNVPADAWPIFFTRLADAEAHLAEAVRLGSTDPAIPAVMMRVGVGLLADKDELSGWFDHAVALEPGERGWYESKLDWLLPKWHGSPEEALGFAREVAAEGGWNLRLPLLVETAWRGLHDGELPPEACEEVLAIHAAFLERYPASVSGLANQARAVDDCGAPSSDDTSFSMQVVRSLWRWAYGPALLAAVVFGAAVVGFGRFDLKAGGR